MPSTPRRSARIQSGATEQKPSRSLLPTFASLPTLIEREETPKHGAKSNSTTFPSPAPLYPDLQTPRAGSRIPMSFEEAHPSKAQKSTDQHLDTGLLFRFVDIPAKNTKKNETPTKSTSTPTPGFEFQFNRPRPCLGPEAQKMMDELRGEAARVKKFEAERIAERAKNGEPGSGLMGVGGRKIAPAKGRSGRFSDIHKAEFRKMDSIAGHPSAFRTQPGRFTPVSTSLKRTKSQAKLDGTHDVPAKPKALRSTSEDEDGRLVNISRAKRIKTFTNEAPSTPRPHSQAGPTDPRDISLPTIPSMPRSKSSLHKASLARTPAIKHSSSTKHMPLAGGYPILQGQEHTNTSTPIPKTNLNLSKDLPLSPSSPTLGLTRATTLKRVAFAPDTNFGFEPDSPAPAANTTPKSRLPLTIGYPTLPKLPPPSGVRASVPHGPGVFTFRSDHKLKFNSAPECTIRQVLPSSSSNEDFAKPTSEFRLPTTLRGTLNEKEIRYGDILFGDSFPKPKGGFELPAVPHGIPNKSKRRYGDISSDEEPAAKKIRGAIRWTPSLHQKATEELKAPRSSKTPRTGASGTGGKKRGVLSLSRLNMLATPKKRKEVEGSGVIGGSGRTKAFWRT
ncbi:MAG: hypothetical protein M1840_003525 [Geoglossum simile]|nr:MAG: hypothetical protein M1840_003525 [Geoglossum simile]